MKILRIIARLNVGGPARHVVWLTKDLQDGEFQSSLIAGTVPGGEEDMNYLAAENGIEPIYIEEMSRELSPKDVVSLYKVFREIRRQRPDIVHTHTAKAGTIGRTAALLYRWLTWKTLVGRPNKIGVVHTFHGHVFHSYYGDAKTKVFLLIEKMLARIATDRIVVISPQQFTEIHEQFGVGRAKQFETVRLGIDLDPFTRGDEKRDILRREIGSGTEELIVGFVGRLTEIKNISLFLNTAARLKTQPVDGVPPLRFVVAGDGHMRAVLETEARELGLEDSLIFLGNRTDTETLYAGMDIVALTSLNEGTPLSLIEAMAAGRPVISTMVGGVPDLLGELRGEFKGFSEYDRGIGIHSFSPDDFASGLIYLAKNEKLREYVGKRGRDFVQSQYSKDRLAEDLRKLYRNLTS